MTNDLAYAILLTMVLFFALLNFWLKEQRDAMSEKERKREDEQLAEDLGIW